MDFPNISICPDIPESLKALSTRASVSFPKDNEPERHKQSRVVAKISLCLEFLIMRLEFLIILLLKLVEFPRDLQEFSVRAHGNESDRRGYEIISWFAFFCNDLLHHYPETGGVFYPGADYQRIAQFCRSMEHDFDLVHHEHVPVVVILSHAREPLFHVLRACSVSS
jgi:hypothetical protein